ncbi:hypothetical protein [Lysinibacillus halotolerans]|uniref:Replication protein n=1 Tax=Lysinibacillus halotolerans TaxID=1368476 RepID=A0A3M8H781_9BACI|nr:hypothetical protein [Lysinibacillus halotolerans]RNC98256.1 hypothetical protein EC501_11665 [Lysinibacillus halotolerans]
MNLLINEPPLQVLPTLATKIGLNNAIVVQQVHYWLRISNNIRDGHAWVYKSMDEWAEQFPFYSKRTVQRIIAELEGKEILVVGNFNKLKFDRTKWYRIDYEKLEKLCNNALRQNDIIEDDNLSSMNAPSCLNESRQNDAMDNDKMAVSEHDKMAVPITREYTENTTENTTEKKKNRKQVYDESSEHYQLAKLLYKKILVDDPSFKEPNLQTWSDHIRLMMERDGRTVEQIKYLIEWSQNNSFWKSNILSTKKLREKATTLIRQIKAEKERESAPKKHNNGQTEIIPEWFKKRNQQEPQTTEQPNENIDFEAERQKILAKLGNN